MVADLPFEWEVVQHDDRSWSLYAYGQDRVLLELSPSGELLRRVIHRSGEPSGDWRGPAERTGWTLADVHDTRRTTRNCAR
jgi:hypothetical protein